MLKNFTPREKIYDEVEGNYINPGEGTCSCGSTVILSSSWANTCPGCGTEYNGSGQQLADRSQWGEETGETVQEMETHLTYPDGWHLDWRDDY